ncbi:sensor histidine kinase [Chloroflexota bacterium]
MDNKEPREPTPFRTNLIVVLLILVVMGSILIATADLLMISKWLQITLRFPIYVAVLLILALIGFVLITYVFSKQRRSKDRLLNSENINIQDLREKNQELDLKLDAERQQYELFMQTITHEVSNPLQSIQTNLDNMAYSSQDDLESYQQYKMIISDDIRRLANLVDRVRDLRSSDSSVPFSPVNIKAVIETVIMSQFEYAEDQGVQLELLDPPVNPSRVLGNREDLECVFRNLVENSIKYSNKDGGKVIISIQEEDNLINVRVTDDGIGISDEDLPKIFEISYRSPDAYLSNRRGLGLGLAIVKQKVERHNGQIRIQSQIGRGTTVSIRLPKT